MYIVREGKKVVYVGHSKTDAKKTLYRHFQLWTDIRTDEEKNASAHDRVTYAGKNLGQYTVKMYYTNTGTEAEILEQLLINKIKPRDNISKILLFSPKQYAAMATAYSEAQTVNFWEQDENETPF